MANTDAAKKAWETRRANIKKQVRADAAKKAWETRNQKQIQKDAVNGMNSKLSFLMGDLVYLKHLSDEELATLKEHIRSISEIINK